VGDTGYHDSYFKEIGAKWPSIDLSLIPIGAYMPRKFMAPVHVDPYEAVIIHREVKSKLSIGMHFGTFNLTDEGSDLPPYELFLALEKEGIPHSEFRVLKPGHAINW
jgi:N-acyl-phosphatidylethanolamine-hydrolysing phospholipase D